MTPPAKCCLRQHPPNKCAIFSVDNSEAGYYRLLLSSGSADTLQALIGPPRKHTVAPRITCSCHSTVQTTSIAVTVRWIPAHAEHKCDCEKVSESSLNRCQPVGNAPRSSNPGSDGQFRRLLPTVPLPELSSCVRREFILPLPPGLSRAGSVFLNLARQNFDIASAVVGRAVAQLRAEHCLRSWPAKDDNAAGSYLSVNDRTQRYRGIISHFTLGPF